MKNGLLIINPVAGTLKARRSVLDIIDVFCKKGWRVTVETTQRRGHCTELAAKAKDEGYELIVCSGGDGTLNEAISGVIKSGSGIPIGYIPQGSTNDFASTLGLPSDPKKCALAITREKPLKIDVGSFNGDRYFSYIASFGAFTDTSYNVPQEAKNVLGHLAYVLGGISELGALHSERVKIVTDQRTHEGSYLFGAISNTTSVAGLVKLDPKYVDLQDGVFEVILIREPQTLFDVNEIINGIGTSDFKGKMFDFFRASKLTVETEPGLKWSLDGEGAECDGHVSIAKLHGAVPLYK